MMEEFTSSLYEDLRTLRREMASHARESSTLFEESKQQAESFKIKVQETFESVAEDVKVSSQMSPNWPILTVYRMQT